MSLPKYVSSNEICEALGDMSKRTLQRRFHCDKNPLPEPCIKRSGGKSMWEESIVLAWLEREQTLPRANRSRNAQETDYDEE